tara:strand:- start:3969 stop:4835 length:867 start_codon:yes stop_codon:yes gene_type:complete
MNIIVKDNTSTLVFTIDNTINILDKVKEQLNSVVNYNLNNVDILYKGISINNNSIIDDNDGEIVLELKYNETICIKNDKKNVVEEQVEYTDEENIDTREVFIENNELFEEVNVVVNTNLNANVNADVNVDECSSEEENNNNMTDSGISSITMTNSIDTNNSEILNNYMYDSNLSDNIDTSVKEFIKLLEVEPYLITIIKDARINIESLPNLMRNLKEYNLKLALNIMDNPQEIFEEIFNIIDNNELNMNDGIKALKDIFPNTTDDILYETLRICDNNVENAINYLFEI